MDSQAAHDGRKETQTTPEMMMNGRKPAVYNGAIACLPLRRLDPAIWWSGTVRYDCWLSYETVLVVS